MKVFIILYLVVGLGLALEFEEVTSSINSFSFKLFKKISEKTDENVVISPFSVDAILKATGMGATGQTAKEIFETLIYKPLQSKMTVAEDNHKLLDRFKSELTFKMANKIFVSKHHTLKPEYIQVTKDNFEADVESVDFGQSEETADKINDWVAKQTSNKITQMVNADKLDDRVAMLLLNAIYFNGDWKIPFDEELTHDGKFWNYGITSTETKMMYNDAHFMYGELPDLKAKAIEMKYKNSEISMLVLLPYEKTGLKNLVTRIETIRMIDIMANMKSWKVRVSIPKFKIEYASKLVEPLREMGMKRMFTDAAEFGDLCVGNETLSVTNVYQKAVIEVNEVGTEASAATMVEMGRMMSVKKFIADHPFLYFVKGPENAVIFMGKVTKF